MAGQVDEPDFTNSACKGMPIDQFFPERGTAQITARDAKSVCWGGDGRPECPVRQTCLDYALDRKERFGIWGGMSERERAREARKRRAEERRREVQLEQARKKRVTAAKAVKKNRRTPPLPSSLSLKELLAAGLISRGEYNQELIHQEHKAALAATRSKETRATRSGKRRGGQAA